MSSPVPIFGTQNLHDDDGAVIDSFLIETDAPPPLTEATQPIPPTPSIRPTILTKILGGTILFPVNATPQPYQLTSADENRQQLHFDVTSFAASPAAVTEYVIYSDDNGKISAGSSSAAGVARNGKGIDLTGGDDENACHTGPLWVIPNPAITGAIEVTWRSVTI